MLRENPEKFGGLSLHMLSAIEDGVFTIELINMPPPATAGTVVSIQTSIAEHAHRLIREGCIDVLCDGWWSSIYTDKIKTVFHGTDTTFIRWCSPLLGPNKKETKHD
jgi:hypothetical protein